MIRKVIISLISIIFIGCGQNELPSSGRDGGTDAAPDSGTGSNIVPQCEWKSDGRPEELEFLGCPDDHEALSGEPSAASLPANRGTMFLVERKLENKVHFFDTLRWRHLTFASEMLDGYPDATVFNTEMYYSPDRRLFLGTLTHYLGPDIFAFEIMPMDKVSPDMLKEMFLLIKEHLRWPADLRYHPTSNALEMESRLPPGVPVVYTRELFEGAEYQGLHLGKTTGRIRLIRRSELPFEYLSRMDIAVLDSVPNDIQAVAGIVTSEFQTPLSHVNLLSQNRGTPNMALLNAIEDARFVDNDGRWVELEVKADGFTIKASSAEEADAFWEDKRPDHVQKPEMDLSVTGLVDIEEVGIDDGNWIPAVGGKAAHFGEMNKIDNITHLVPHAFAIPLYYYDEFVRINGLDIKIQHLLENDDFRNDGLFRKEALEDLRDKFMTGDMDSGLVDMIRQKIADVFGDIRIRFRSSSNAEDLEGFNGAGLYTSQTGTLNDPEDTIEKALATVWSSLWNFAAFEERQWARVDHASCGMGVLVHRSFPDINEAANGVAVTANPFDPPPSGQAAYFINVQAGAVSVTNPSPGITPESFLYYKPPAGQGEMTYLSDSSLTDNERVLSFDEIVELVTALREIHDHFHGIYRYEPFGMDVEFKFINPGRELVIKQARPYIF